MTTLLERFAPGKVPKSSDYEALITAIEESSSGTSTETPGLITLYVSQDWNKTSDLTYLLAKKYQTEIEAKRGSSLTFYESEPVKRVGRRLQDLLGDLVSCGILVQPSGSPYIYGKIIIFGGSGWLNVAAINDESGAGVDYYDCKEFNTFVPLGDKPIVCDVYWDQYGMGLSVKMLTETTATIYVGGDKTSGYKWLNYPTFLGDTDGSDFENILLYSDADGDSDTTDSETGCIYGFNGSFEATTTNTSTFWSENLSDLDNLPNWFYYGRMPCRFNKCVKKITIVNQVMPSYASLNSENLGGFNWDYADNFLLLVPCIVTDTVTTWFRIPCLSTASFYPKFIEQHSEDEYFTYLWLIPESGISQPAFASGSSLSSELYPNLPSSGEDNPNFTQYDIN